MRGTVNAVPRFLLVLVVLSACVRPVPRARHSVIEPPAPIEVDAEVQVRSARCNPHWGLAFPGLGHLCMGDDDTGGILAAGTAVAGGATYYGYRQTEDGEHAAVVVPLVIVQDLWVYGLSDVGIRKALAKRQLYAPRDTLTDVVAAPFNHEVMKRPAVWGGLLGFLAVGIGASLALAGDVPTDKVGDDANLFGETVTPELGYPAAAAMGTVLFGHVAVAEEALFRGYLQSSLARNAGETTGWLAASAIFGLAHVPNAWALPSQDRRDYLLYGIPIITAAGGYLGWLYQSSGYSMAPPVAVHFWYDLLLSATLFALEPDNSIFSAKISLPL